MDFMLWQGVNDLNWKRLLRDPFPIFRGGFDARRQARVRAGDGVRALAHVSSLGGEVSGRLQRSPLQLPGPVPVSCLRATDLSGELARHRSVSARAARQAVPSGPRGNVSRSALADANEE